MKQPEHATISPPDDEPIEQTQYSEIPTIHVSECLDLYIAGIALQF
jgi:hypothetical protein